MLLDSPTLASLRFFEAAARLLSFKRAALELHVTQGAVSQQIKHLEGALGCKLFHRLPRQITLTEEGQRFAVVVERALGEIRHEAQAIASAHSMRDIRVRAGPSFALRWLVPRLGEFYARHPDINLIIMAAYGYFDPARREFDLAIETILGQPPSMHAELLMEEQLMPVCTPAYLAKHDFLKEPKDLARCTLLHDVHPWVGANQDAEWRYWLDGANATEVDSNQGQFFSLANMSIEAALAHQGLAMGRSALVGELLETGQLVAPLVQRVKSPVKYWLLSHQEIAGRREITLLGRWLHEQAKRSRPAAFDKSEPKAPPQTRDSPIEIR